MTANEITKALGYCEDCSANLNVEIIDLINRYEAENKSLYKINAKADEEISELRKKLLKRQNLEESFLKTTKDFDKKLAKTVKLERAEAIKKFAEKVKANKNKLFNYIYSSRGFDEQIDNLVKEMAGEDK